MVKILVVISSVWPSGADFATVSVPMRALAPGRFSTTNCWPVLAVMRCARLRAMMSVPPPGANGTISLTARVGYVPGADAGAAAACAQAAATPAKPQHKCRSMRGNLAHDAGEQNGMGHIFHKSVRLLSSAVKHGCSAQSARGARRETRAGALKPAARFI